MEKVLWLIERVKSGLQSFVLEISHWTMLHGQVDQLKLQWSNQDINWEQSTLYHVGDSWQTQNIQINKVIGESDTCLLFYAEKNLNGLFGLPGVWLVTVIWIIVSSHSLICCHNLICQCRSAAKHHLKVLVAHRNILTWELVKKVFHWKLRNIWYMSK